MASAELVSLGKETGQERPHITFEAYYPHRILPNSEIESWKIRTQSGNILRASDIKRRTGVEQRYVAGPSETPFSMGKEALKSALDGESAIDVLLVSSSHPTGANLADQIRLSLNLKVDSLMEIGAACSGAVLGLTYLKENENRFAGHKVALVATEKYSDTLEDLRVNGVQADPSLAQTIFSDGAVTMVFTYGEDLKVLSYINYQFPEEVSQCLRMPIDKTLIRHPYLEQPIPPSNSGKFEQDGRKVYEAVVTSIPPLVEKAVADAGLKPDDITLVIPHQGSTHVVDGLSKRLGKYELYKDVSEGNFSSASIPKALMRAIEEKKAKRGDRIVLAGFGAGLFVSIAVVKLG